MHDAGQSRGSDETKQDYKGGDYPKQFNKSQRVTVGVQKHSLHLVDYLYPPVYRRGGESERVRE